MPPYDANYSSNNSVEGQVDQTKESFPTTRTDSQNPFVGTVELAARQLDWKSAYAALRSLSFNLDAQECLLLSKAIKECEQLKRKEFLLMAEDIETAANYMNMPDRIAV